jgi:hypothetical protein
MPSFIETVATETALLLHFVLVVAVEDDAAVADLLVAGKFFLAFKSQGLRMLRRKWRAEIKRDWKAKWDEIPRFTWCVGRDLRL